EYGYGRDHGDGYQIYLKISPPHKGPAQTQDHRQRYGRSKQPHTVGQQAGKHKSGACGVTHRLAKALSQKLVGRGQISLVIFRQKKDAHKYAPDNITQRDLQKSKVAAVSHCRNADKGKRAGFGGYNRRSEEHTSELQSRFELVCRLLLEK